MKCVITVDRGVRQDHTVNVFLLNFCKFDHKKYRENADCTVMISKLYCNVVFQSAKRVCERFLHSETALLFNFCKFIK